MFSQREHHKISGYYVLKKRIFDLGQGTSSYLCHQPSSVEKIVQMINYLLLFFNADIKASCNCVKTTVIQQRTIDSIQAWAELCILSNRRIAAGTYQIPAKVFMMGHTAPIIKTLRNKRCHVQAELSCIKKKLQKISFFATVPNQVLLAK